MVAGGNKQLLLDRIGGEDALALAVDKFYEKHTYRRSWCPA
jgi:truncated hemoglobin YjbI